MTQFDLYMADLPHQEDSHILRGHHPVVIVSNNLANAYSPVITVVPVTSKIKRLDMPTHILLYGSGLWKESMAVCEQVMSLDSSRCIYPIGHVHNSDTQAALMRGIHAQLGMRS